MLNGENKSIFFYRTIVVSVQLDQMNHDSKLNTCTWRYC